MSRHVLITGGSRGIGAAAARQFAREGWRVSINYCRSREQALALAEELRALGGGAAALDGQPGRLRCGGPHRLEPGSFCQSGLPAPE